MSERQFRRVALAQKVLAVASIEPQPFMDIEKVKTVESPKGFWTAYVDAVRGENHDYEWQLVAASGDKLPQKVAEVLFPDIAKDYLWRD